MPGLASAVAGATPRPVERYAERGTLLHALAAIGILHTLAAMDEEAAAAHIELAPDERAALATYVKFCKALRSGAAMWRVEQRVILNAELYGTIDFFALKSNTLHVVDFKAGRGLRVEAIDNPQLLTYAMMVCKQMLVDPTNDALPRINTVHLHIVQPLFEGDAPIRGVSYTRAQIADWHTKVPRRWLAAKQPDAPFNPGEHCRFCPVKPHLPGTDGARHGHCRRRRRMAALPVTASSPIGWARPT